MKWGLLRPVGSLAGLGESGIVRTMVERTAQARRPARSARVALLRAAPCCLREAGCRCGRRPAFRGSRGHVRPGRMIPARFAGSAAATAMVAVHSRLRAARSESTASGRANCSPPKPETKRPPRISPRASRRRRMPSRSRHLGALDSRVRRSRKRTP